MVELGAIGRESLARLTGSNSDWKSVAALKGIDWSKAPEWAQANRAPATAVSSSGGLGGGMLVALLSGIGVVIAGVVMVVLLSRGSDSEMSPPDVADSTGMEVPADGGSGSNADRVASQDGSPSAPSSPVLSDLAALVEVQSMVANDLVAAAPALIDELQPGVVSGEIAEADARRRFAQALTPSTQRQIDRFAAASLATKDRSELESLARRSGVPATEAVRTWMVFEVLLALNTAEEVWMEEITLRELDPSLVASIGLVGENTMPDLTKGIQIVRQDDARLLFRCFGGTFEYRLIEQVNGSQVLGGSAVQVRNAVRNQSFELALQSGGERPIEAGRGGTIGSLIGDYIERWENQPWASESVATDGISIANVILHEGDYGDDGTSPLASTELGAATGGFGPEWLARHHRAVPLMWMVDEDERRVWHGTGFVVTLGDRWYVVTNRHVIDGAVKAMMVFMSVDDGGRPIDIGPEAYVRLDREVNDFTVHQYGNDLAVVDVTQDRPTLEAGGVVPLTLATPDDVSRGAQLVWIGHPGSSKDGSEATNWREKVGIEIDAHRVTRGEAAVLKREVIGYGDMQPGSPWQPFESYAIITTGTIVGGNSGGPMIRASDGAVVGVCTAGSAQGSGGERNIGIRGRHVVETIQSGIRFDRATMSNGLVEEVAGRVAGGEQAPGPDRAAVVAACGAIADWPLTDAEMDWLDWAVTPGEGGGNWTPMYCTVIDLPAAGTDLDLHQWMIREKLDLRSQYWIFASPESEIDIDLFGFNSLQREVAKDDSASSHASIRIEGVVGDQGSGTLRIHNHDRKQTRVLLLFCHPRFADSLSELMAACDEVRNWPLTDSEYSWLSWAIRKGEDGGGWTPLHCEVFDLPADGTVLEFEDWIRSHKLGVDRNYWVFVSPKAGDDIDLFGYDSRGREVVKDVDASVYASFRVDSVGGSGVSTLRVVNHDKRPSQILLVVCN